jgi:hypothetical protein
LQQIESESFSDKNLITWKSGSSLSAPKVLKDGTVYVEPLVNQALLDKVENILLLENKKRETRRVINSYNEHIKKIVDNQGRLRDNIKSLDKMPNVDLIKRYMKDLGTQEDDLFETRGKIETLEAEEAKLENELKRFSNEILVQIQAKKSAELLWKEIKTKSEQTFVEIENSRAQLAQISEFLGAIERYLILEVNPATHGLPNIRLQNILTKLASFLPTCIHTINFQHSYFALAVIKEKDKDIIQLFQYPIDSTTIPHFVPKEVVHHMKNTITDNIFVCQIIFVHTPTTIDSQLYGLPQNSKYILVDISVPGTITTTTTNVDTKSSIHM